MREGEIWERDEREREYLVGEGRSQGKESKSKRTGTNVLHGEGQVFNFWGEEKTCFL